MMEIESRKDRDAFFDSLGGWNNDDKLGKNAQAKERKRRKKEEREARNQLKKERAYAQQLF